MTRVELRRIIFVGETSLGLPFDIERGGLRAGDLGDQFVASVFRFVEAGGALGGVIGD